MSGWMLYPIVWYPIRSDVSKLYECVPGRDRGRVFLTLLKGNTGAFAHEETSRSHDEQDGCGFDDGDFDEEDFAPLAGPREAAADAPPHAPGGTGDDVQARAGERSQLIRARA